jgi:hypothetical protein
MSKYLMLNMAGENSRGTVILAGVIWMLATITIIGVASLAMAHHP